MTVNNGKVRWKRWGVNVDADVDVVIEVVAAIKVVQKECVQGKTIEVVTSAPPTASV